MTIKHAIKQMAWLSCTEGDNTKVLHLRTGVGKPWRPYTTFPDFAAPDHHLLQGSSGFATFQKLLQAGWELVPTDKAKQLSLFENQTQF